MTSDFAKQTSDAYREILRRLNEFTDPPIMIGGAAVVALGSDRLTKDVDIAFQDARALLTVMYDFGFKAIAKAERDENGELTEVSLFPEIATAFQCTLDRRALIFIHEVTQARFDVWLAPHVPYDQLLKNSFTADFDGVPIRVASAEDLIAMKRIALENNPKRATDLMDIAFLEKKLGRPRNE